MSQHAAFSSSSHQLLLSVAEELKVPLIQIARMAEAGNLLQHAAHADIQHTADAALKLLDNYALAVRLQLEAESLPQEAVSVSAVLYDAEQELAALAQAYGVELDLHVAGRYGTVMAHRAGLQAALTSLGASLIESMPALVSGQRQLRLEFATHRSRYGIVAGIYTNVPQINRQTLERGRRLQPVSKQPLNHVSHTSSAGIFVADSILHAMNLELTASRHRSLYGFGTVLQPNKQLELL